jgi:Trk-type K+ transport system membrane component
MRKITAFAALFLIFFMYGAIGFPILYDMVIESQQTYYRYFLGGLSCSIPVIIGAIACWIALRKKYKTNQEKREIIEK